MEEQNFIQVLFGILIGFVVLNATITLFLNHSYRESFWRQLFIYWLSVLATFCLQAIPKTEMQILMFVTVSYLPLTLLSRITFLEAGKKFPWSICLTGYAVSFPALYLIHKAGAGFTAAALPISVASTVPLIAAMIVIVKNWKNCSTPVRFMMIPYLSFSVHNFNFAFFRMEPDAQLWGWAVSFGIYQALGILLPAIVIEKTKRTENKRLFTIVEERTRALKKTASDLENEVKIKKDLIKVVLHDISNPLTSLLGRLYLLEAQKMISEQGKENYESAILAGNAITNIIRDVRAKQSGNLREKRAIHTSKDLDKTFYELKSVYAPMLEQKNIKLKIINGLPSNFEYLSERSDALKNTVFSNLISNAIKFSHTNSEILVNAYTISGELIVDIQDFGVGISQSVIKSIESGINPGSKKGTGGEEGTGFGLLLAKNFVERNGGAFEINPDESVTGTLFRVRLRTSDKSSLESPLDSSAHSTVYSPEFAH